MQQAHVSGSQWREAKPQYELTPETKPYGIYLIQGHADTSES